MSKYNLPGAPRPFHEAGFTLLEVMVTLFIVSIGLLGIAGMQMLSKQANYEAVQRTTASFLAQDILERMRANPGSLAAYLTNGVGRRSIGSEPSPACNSSAAPCSSAELAEHDLWEWERALDGAAERTPDGVDTGGIVSPTGCVTGPGGGGAGAYVVAVAWRGQTALSDPTASACGQTSGLYGNNNEFRRILVLDTYISDE